MQGFRVEGVILKRRNLGEADRILTVFTHQKGKITVLAKGVRRITSRRGGNVELLNRSLMYLHPARSFLILTEAQVLDTYSKLKEDLILSATAFHIIELTDRMTAENQENMILYEHLVHVLQKLVRNPRQIFLRAYEVKILSTQGFADFSEGLLFKLKVLSWDEIEKIKLNQKEALELEQVLQYHIERVLEGPLKSRQLLKKL
ncbi:MAG: DNA repair protein RecO [Candidatus Daviesbacteria bacterium]|nr:DNA repair protein RecO [Candidatus Daviesbacteria bacterium]